jgi:hypothetical protein
MSHRNFAFGVFSLVAMVTLSGTGCVGITLGPDMGFLGVPIPVSPYYQKLEEDQAWNHERYERVIIMGPLTAGGPVAAIDPPSDDEVMRAFEEAKPQQGGLPYLFELQRNNVRIVKDKIADYVDPPRFIPTIGPAQLHHAHYKCTIYYSEIKRVGWPVPYTTRDEDAVEVIYIDHNHFHMCGNIDSGVSAAF